MEAVDAKLVCVGLAQARPNYIVLKKPKKSPSA